MYRTRTFVRGLLVVGIAATLCGYVLAAERSTQTDQDQATQQKQQRQAQQQTQQQRQQTSQPGMTSPQGQNLLRTSQLIGKEVKNAQAEDLGSIYDLVLTPDHQQVSYAAVSHGGTWGIGAKYFAVPWSAFQVGSQGDLTLSVSKDQLEQASGFERGNWPAQPNWQLFTSMTSGRMSGQRSQMGTQRESMDRDRDRTAGDTTRTTTGRTADTAGTEREGTTDTQRQTAQADTEREGATGTDRERRMMGRTGADMGPGAMAMSRDIESRRVTNLTGMNVLNNEGEDIGNIEGFVVDAGQGQVAYAIVSFGGFWGIGEKYAVVPASAVNLEPRRDVARLNADRQTLESIAFEPGNFPDLTNSQYAQQLHQTFGAEPYWIILGFVSPEQRQQASQQAWGTQSEFAKQFNAQTVKTVQGTVQSIGTFQPEGASPGAAQGMRIRLTTQEGDLVTVYGGPQWYAQQHDFYVRPGDSISVTGSETKIGWRQVLVASQIKADDRTLQLRSETGQPLWQTPTQGQQGQTEQRQGTMQNRPGRRMRQPGGAGQSEQENP